ncbi:MAG: phosphomethylpyrimidine synthase ThiC [candidate division WOR-3 bacterium]
MTRGDERVEDLLVVAGAEGLGQDELAKSVREGRVVLLASHRRKIRPVAVGEGTRVKVNANLGTSPDCSDVKTELDKLKVAVEAGADTVMDLSVGADADEVRGAVIAESTLPVGTVPVYQAALDARLSGKSFVEATRDEILRAVRKHLEDGVDFITVHCGLTRENAASLARAGRLCGVVSRGGSMMIEWMVHNQSENPLYECYDEVLAMARESGATLSLGDGLRPGALADATDEPQVRELVTLGELVRRARAAGVQVMVEGPGHVPLDQIEANVRLEKAVCNDAPFYVLGPLVTDVACSHDHIAAAIGGAVAAWYGADFLCYVTPSEHLGLPDIEDVREGVIAARIAAHAADVARRHEGAAGWDRIVSACRAVLDWDGMIRQCVDPERARTIFDAARSQTEGACTMCGEFCAMRRMKGEGLDQERQTE